MTIDRHTGFPAVSEGTIGNATLQTVDGRDLHSFLGVGKDFSTWIKDRINQFGFEEGVDYVTLQDLRSPESGSTKARAQISIEYHLTLDMAKELSMVERNEQGKKARLYFIECERRVKEPAAVIDVRDMSQLSKIALQLIEVNQELKDRVNLAERKVEQAKPKTDFFDQFANAEGLYGLQNAARVLSEPPNKFVGWLKQGYLFYQGGSLVPKVHYREMGIFEVKATMVEDKARYRTFMTPKGIQYFARKLGKAPPDMFAGQLL